MSLIIAGGIRYGNHIVKSLALGANGVAMGRAFIISAEAGDKAFDGNGARGIENFVRANLVDVQQLTSSLGKYDISQLGLDDVEALDRDVANMFGIRYLYD
jgi:isopentenyl diphosphate isomerase/L-lactate dehydrogenase-like FMN-dependent dehydrogenase